MMSTAPRTNCAPLAGNSDVPAVFKTALRPSMRSLTIAGCIFGVLALFFLPVIFAPLGMVFGVAALAKGRAENGLAVIVLAAVCGYYGFTNSLHIMNLWTTADVVNMLRPASPTVAVGDNNFHVVSLQTRVTNTDEVDPICNWRLEVKNDSHQQATFHGVIEFQDEHGVKISEDRVTGYPVAAGTVGVFTGSLPVKSKTKIARAIPQITVGG